VDKYLIADRVTGKMCKARLKPDKLCLACGAEEYMEWLGLEGRRCYPLTPERYSRVIQYFKPRWGGFGCEAYVLPDTVRIIDSVLVVFSPRGAASEEVLYDVREGTLGFVREGRFWPLEIVGNPQCVETTPRFCYMAGTAFIDRTRNVVRVVQILTDMEYAAYLRALVTKRPDVTPWEVLEKKVAVYENAISELMTELSKLGEMTALEVIQNVLARARQVMGAVDMIRQPQQQPGRT